MIADPRLDSRGVTTGRRFSVFGSFRDSKRRESGCTNWSLQRMVGLYTVDIGTNDAHQSGESTCRS